MQFLRQGQANVTTHSSQSHSFVLTAMPMHWQQVSSHLLAINLPDHYLNTAARMGVQQKFMVGEGCDYPFCSQKQFQVAIAQSSTLSSFLQRYLSRLCLHLSSIALNHPTPAVITFVPFLVESIGLAS